LIERLSGDPPSPYEQPFGFSRVARAGGFVRVGGTTSVDEHGVVAGETPYEQTTVILEKVKHELSRFGLTFDDVVQTRVYVTDISRYEEVGRAHGEAFAAIRPVMTLVGVSGLVDPRMLVEIETLARVRDDGGSPP
jgi:enamine deaminase RidA (YjgF/YER057c/UK114 family)